MSEEHGVQVPSVFSYCAWTHALFFPDFKDWDKGVEFIVEDAKLVKDLGAASILMHFGTTRGSWGNCKAALMDVAAACEENGVVFGYEANIWERTELSGVDGLIRMLNEVGTPCFGVYLDNASLELVCPCARRW